MAAALAANLGRDRIDELTSLDAPGLVLGNTGNQADLAVGHTAENHRRAAQLVAQLVHQLAQRLGIHGVHARRQYLEAIQLYRLRRQIIALLVLPGAPDLTHPGDQRVPRILEFTAVDHDPHHVVKNHKQYDTSITESDK